MAIDIAEANCSGTRGSTMDRLAKWKHHDERLAFRRVMVTMAYAEHVEAERKH